MRKKYTESTTGFTGAGEGTGVLTDEESARRPPSGIGAEDAPTLESTEGSIAELELTVGDGDAAPTAVAAVGEWLELAVSTPGKSPK